MQEDLQDNNHYIHSFMGEIKLTESHVDLQIVLHADKNMKPQEANCRTYNLPKTPEVAAIHPGTAICNQDIILRCTGESESWRESMRSTVQHERKKIPRESNLCKSFESAC